VNPLCVHSYLQVSTEVRIMNESKELGPAHSEMSKSSVTVMTICGLQD
jgi:hypothetical protein